jgi:signal transduction histidine kinase
MIFDSEDIGRAVPESRLSAKWRSALRTEKTKGRILVVEDEEMLRDATGLFLEEAGYEVLFAENGKEALRRLYTEALPALIVLDLRMPVMDGWEFRTIQRDDPNLGLIPVVAISADGSSQASAISADAYLRKPVNAIELLITIERVLVESEWQRSVRQDEAERLTALGHLAANVGHEINNPLTFVMLNLRQSLERLRPSIASSREAGPAPSAEAQLMELNALVRSVVGMLEECEVGTERIRATVGNLQRLSRHGEGRKVPVDVHELIDQSVAMVWNQIRHRARLLKTFGKIPLICGNGPALGQVFLNLLINAAQAIPEGDAEQNTIRVSTWVELGAKGADLVVEIGDSGIGIAPEIMSRMFEPFFTTKRLGEGTGLGLSISHQTVGDHGGRMTVDSAPGKGATFRIFLPIGDTPAPLPVVVPSAGPSSPFRGRVLVIDDEPLIGRVVQNVLKNEHDVFFEQQAAAAVCRLERGERFDAILCDLVMPDVSGPTFYATVAQRWPDLVEHLVFMSGGAFTPATLAFMAQAGSRVLAKPFEIDQLKQIIRQHLRLDV